MCQLTKINTLATNSAALDLLSHCFVYPKQPEKFIKKINLYTSNSTYKCYGLIAKNKKLIGIIIIEQKNFQTIIIQGIACDVLFRKKGMASKMIHCIIEKYQPKTILAETDNDSAGFYSKFGFYTQTLKEKYPETTRYLCRLTLPLS